MGRALDFDLGPQEVSVFFLLLFMALGKSLILDFSLSVKKQTVLISHSEVF